jgi:hypothetical protein
VTATKACFRCGAAGLAIGVTEKSHRVVEHCCSCSGWTFFVLSGADAALLAETRKLEVVDLREAA